jgi:uncharacterized membrane protein
MLMAVDFIFRWSHVLFGLVWIGMLYYFNFVQTEYFKEAEASAKADAMKKLAPRALWWFRWGAMFTFLTGLVLLHRIGADRDIAGQPVIWVGVIAGILMFLNVWLVIWPKQRVVLGLREGDAASSAAAAGLASRTNTLLSGPMLFGMLGSKHLFIADAGGTGFYACVALLLLLEANGLFGKLGPLASVKGVIHCSIALTAAMWLLLALL